MSRSPRQGERGSPFETVLHRAPRLGFRERLGSLGLAVAASVLLVCLVFLLWWVWLTWMPVADPYDGAIPVLIGVE